MALINHNSLLSEIIQNDPTVIPVINRFDITLGTKDNTIASTCSKHNIDIDFFLSILNTFINKDYFPETTLKSFQPTEIVAYLTKTNNYYLHFQIPNIERHFNSLINRSGNANNLSHIKSFFDELKTRLIERINFDNSQLFNAVINSKSISIPNNINDSTNYEDQINDLKNMFIIHLNGEYDLNLCYAVITAIHTFEKDFQKNNRVRDRILLPLYHSSH